MVSPLKEFLSNECADFDTAACRLAKKIDEAVVERFGLQNFDNALIADADLKALATERRDLLPASSTWDSIADIKPHAFPIIRQFEREARSNFINMYYVLGGK